MKWVVVVIGWVAVVIGLAWPFGVALAGVAMAATSVEHFNCGALGLFVASFLGIPVAVAGVILLLPLSWNAWGRVTMALLLVIPLSLGAVYVAFVAFVIGYVVVGGWIPA